MPPEEHSSSTETVPDHLEDLDETSALPRTGNRLLLYEHDGQAWVRAAATWDPMPWHIARACRAAGRDAQHAFWGERGASA